MTELDVTLRDGRTLHVYDEGDPNGVAVVVHHGTPSSGRLHPSDIEDARARGIRLIGFDRAGYGGSSAHLGRSFADVSADVADLLDVLGADRFATWGHSGGGPTHLPVPRSSPSAAWRPPRSPPLRRTASRGSTGSRGWGRGTSRSSNSCSRAARRSSRPCGAPRPSSSAPDRTGCGRRC